MEDTKGKCESYLGHLGSQISSPSKWSEIWKVSGWCNSTERTICTKYKIEHSHLHDAKIHQTRQKWKMQKAEEEERRKESREELGRRLKGVHRREGQLASREEQAYLLSWGEQEHVDWNAWRLEIAQQRQYCKLTKEMTFWRQEHRGTNIGWEKIHILVPGYISESAASELMDWSWGITTSLTGTEQTSREASTRISVWRTQEHPVIEIWANHGWSKERAT